jgi:endonuclease/exonuclease/phosphatase (EEP) superfamily protein YafD
VTVQTSVRSSVVARLRGVSRRSVAVAAVFVLPWTWFLLRDHLGTFGDLVSLGAPFFAIPVLALVALAAVWLPFRVVAAWLISLALVLFFVIYGPRLPTRMGDPVDPIVLVAANVRFDNPTPDAAAEDLLEIDADVVVVPETTPRMVTLLRQRYEHFAQVEQDEHGIYATGVFSRFELEGADTLGLGNAVLRVEVAAPHPFVLVASHLDRPSIAPGDSGYVTHGDHYEEVVALHEAVADEQLPVVIAGDLNLSDRTRGYRYLDRRYEDLARRGWAGSTYMAGIYRYFLLRIDHVFAAGNWCSEHVDEFSISGSDHRGIRLDVGPCR